MPRIPPISQIHNWFFSAWSLMLVAAAGTGFRVYQLRNQVLVDDEWHALNALLRSSYTAIFSDFGMMDHCIPLTLFYRLMADTAVLSELIMRIPALLFGAAALFLIPLLLREWIGQRAALLLACLLAISPIHIFFSRYARPYSIVVLLSLLGMISFYKWWSGGSRVWKAVYLLCAVIGPWFHLVCLPILMAPIVFALAELGLRPKSNAGRQAADLIKTCLQGLFGLLILLGVPVWQRFGAVSSKAREGQLTWESVLGASQYLLGTLSPWLMIALILGMILGIAVLMRQQARFAAYVLLGVAAQLLAIGIIRPAWIQAPIVLARYCIVIVPCLLALAAAGINQADLFLKSRLRFYPLPAVSLAMIIGLLWLSPLRALYYWPNNFLNQGYMQYGFDYPKYLFTYRPPVTPQFYEKLRGTPPGKYLLVEAPWNFGWHSFGYYQSLHGQRVAIGFVDTNIDNCRPGELPLGNRNFAFRNFIHVSDHARLMAEKVKYVIFHKQLLQELPNPFGDKPVDVSNRIKHYTALYGPPVYEDTLITVFNVLRSSIPLGK